MSSQEGLGKAVWLAGVQSYVGFLIYFDCHSPSLWLKARLAPCIPQKTKYNQIKA